MTNIRNVASPHWRAWLKPEYRCVVPATSFCEYEDMRPKKTPTWFALAEGRSLFAFASLWRPWRGTKANPVEGQHLLFSFLICQANAEVASIHPKAMPVILTTPDEVDACLAEPVEDVSALQRPLPNGALQIVARGERQDSF